MLSSFSSRTMIKYKSSYTMLPYNGNYFIQVVTLDPKPHSSSLTAAQMVERLPGRREENTGEAFPGFSV